MSITMKFYNDPGLTSLAPALTVTRAADGSSSPADRVLYLGSTAVATKFQAASNPGADNITVAPVDSDAGSGVEPSHVRLALSSGGLASATPGAALQVGSQLLSGSGNAVAVHVRMETPLLSSGIYSDLSIMTNSCIEVPA